ncbi:MAG: four helix bundle protein [Limisphaerales bacterium]
MREGDMTYHDWLATVPTAFTGDPVWKVEAYRLAMFAADLAWHDSTKLLSDKRTLGLAGQLNRSAGGVPSDIAEGYSRQSHKDQARFYEYALGSARESRNWTYQGRHILTERVTGHRLELYSQIIRLLLTMIPNERAAALREEPAEAYCLTALLNAAVPFADPPPATLAHAPRTTNHA